MPVYKSKDVTKDGRKWYFKCQYKDVYGERHTKKSKKYAFKQEAHEAERMFLINCGKANVDDGLLWNDVVYEFLENSHNKDGTLYSKKINIEKYGNLFTNKKVNDITPLLVEKWKKMIDEYDLATSTKQNIFNYFKTAMDYAVKKHYIKINPFRQVENFQKNPNEIEEKNEAELYLIPEEFNHFITCVDDKFWRLFFSFAFFMGTRKGEQIAVQWKDIDFNNHTVKISKQINTKGLKKENLFIPTKNGVIRIISIPDKLWEMLIEHYKLESKIIGFNEEFFVFGNIKYISYTTIDRKKDYYFEIANVKRITMHQFRHSHASLLISNNVPLNVIAKRLGDTPEIVLKTYAHLFPEKEAEVLNILNKF